MGVNRMKQIREGVKEDEEVEAFLLPLQRNSAVVVALLSSFDDDEYLHVSHFYMSHSYTHGLGHICCHWQNNVV